MLDLHKLKQVADLFGRGVVLQMAPRIAGGMINRFFHEWNVDVARISQDVQHNRCLWDNLTPDQREQLKNGAQKIGSLDFITTDFIITSIRKDFLAVATLFVNWPEAGEWLARQIDELKREISDEAA